MNTARWHNAVAIFKLFRYTFIMRIWSFHPKYLDSKGLVALWRETLLAKHVLLGKTKGYRHHPQLIRFRQHSQPITAIDYYLSVVYQESLQRGYNFNADKFETISHTDSLSVTTGQMDYERQHLLNKLSVRDPELYEKFQQESTWQPHPLFEVIDGDVADWEIVS